MGDPWNGQGDLGRIAEEGGNVSVPTRGSPTLGMAGGPKGADHGLRLIQRGLVPIVLGQVREHSAACATRIHLAGHGISPQRAGHRVEAQAREGVVVGPE